MFDLPLPTPTHARTSRILVLVVCLLIGMAHFSGAQPGSQDEEGKSFGPLSHRPASQPALSLMQLPKKWHRTLKRRIKGLDDESEKGRLTSLSKLLGTLAHQEQLAKSKRASRKKGPGPADVAYFIETQIVKELQRARGVWAVSALVQTVLNESEKDEERVAALNLLVKSKHNDASTLLLVVSNRGDQFLRNAALIAMAHWPREELDMHLCQGFARNPTSRSWKKLVAHRVGSHGPLDQKAGALLIPVLRQMVVSEDWKIAGQALWIAKGLSKERQVEFLVTSIASVADAVKSGTVRWRILSDIGRELRAISGRSMGLDPRPWQAWYERVKAGEMELDITDEAEPRSSVEFFGIGRVSDHVTFVIDGSGSMAAPWGTGGNTFYEEAVRQMVAYLSKMGEGTYFRVVLFASDAKVMVPLQQVDEDTVEDVEKIMLKRQPQGGTELGTGVELALERNERDEKKAKQGSSDAFIVLCDGVTMEGADWAAALIASEDFPLGLRFHCVQLGRSPAGAMKALAEGTGGKFVRVKP